MKNYLKRIAYFNMRALFMGIGLSSILIEVKEYFFLSFVIGTFIGLIIVNLKRNNNKIINIICNSFLFISAYFILINVISTMYLTNMPRFLIGLPILLILFYFVNLKNNTIDKTSTILLILNFLLFIFAFFSLYKYINFNIIHTKFDILKIISASYKYAFYSSIPLLIIKDNETKYTKTYLISTLSMFIIFLITYLILGNHLIDVYRFPEYIVLKQVDLGNFIQNVENIISFIWLIDLIMMILTTTNNIKKYMNNKSIYFYLIFLFIIVLIIGKYYVLVISLYKFLHIVLFFCLIFITDYNFFK